MSKITAFLGDTPLRVLLKLLVVSFIVGALMVSLGWTPLDLLVEIKDFVVSLFTMGFEALGRFGEYIAVGAVVVVPLFILMRLFARKG